MHNESAFVATSKKLALFREGGGALPSSRQSQGRPHFHATMMCLFSKLVLLIMLTTCSTSGLQLNPCSTSCSGSWAKVVFRPLLGFRVVGHIPTIVVCGNQRQHCMFLGSWQCVHMLSRMIKLTMDPDRVRLCTDVGALLVGA